MGFMKSCLLILSPTVSNSLRQPSQVIQLVASGIPWEYPRPCSLLLWCCWRVGPKRVTTSKTRPSTTQVHKIINFLQRHKQAIFIGILASREDSKTGSGQWFHFREGTAFSVYSFLLFALLITSFLPQKQLIENSQSLKVKPSPKWRARKTHIHSPNKSKLNLVYLLVQIINLWHICLPCPYKQRTKSVISALPGELSAKRWKTRRKKKRLCIHICQIERWKLKIVGLVLQTFPLLQKIRVWFQTGQTS